MNIVRLHDFIILYLVNGEYGIMKKIFILFTLFIVGASAYAFYTGMDINYQRGCCSHHGGVSYCGRSGYFICADGTQSPSCRCR